MIRIFVLSAVAALLCVNTSFADEQRTRTVPRSVSGGSAQTDLITVGKADGLQKLDDSSRAMPKLDEKTTLDGNSKKQTRTLARSMSGGSGLADRIIVHKE